MTMLNLEGNLLLLFAFVFFFCINCLYFTSFYRKDKEQQEDKQSDGNTEKEQEQIDQIIKDSLGKLSKRGVSSQVRTRIVLR